jgi:soluble lytic murein transglycosylase-like protein
MFFALLVVFCVLIYIKETQRYIPVSIQDTQQINIIQKKLELLNIPYNEKLIMGIDFASKQTEISPDIIIALIYTESTFNKNALSFGNGGKYKGLMQIPHEVFYVDANIIIGARILKEKLRYTKGDMKKAILLYKGYPLDSERGHQQVQKVYVVYHKIKGVK